MMIRRHARFFSVGWPVVRQLIFIGVPVVVGSIASWYEWRFTRHPHSSLAAWLLLAITWVLATLGAFIIECVGIVVWSIFAPVKD
jgi:hypothetical protein